MLEQTHRQRSQEGRASDRGLSLAWRKHPGGWGDGSAGRVLACKQEDVSLTPRPRKSWEQQHVWGGGYRSVWGLRSGRQFSQIYKGLVRDSVSNTKMENSLRKIPQALASTCMHTYVDIESRERSQSIN